VSQLKKDAGFGPGKPPAVQRVQCLWGRLQGLIHCSTGAAGLIGIAGLPGRGSTVGMAAGTAQASRSRPPPSPPPQPPITLCTVVSCHPPFPHHDMRTNPGHPAPHQSQYPADQSTPPAARLQAAHPPLLHARHHKLTPALLSASAGPSPSTQQHQTCLPGPGAAGG
jgi:hypothetical protein